MPKENTHLLFADRLMARFTDPDIRILLRAYQEVFFLGAVLPDAFFYHPRKEVIAVSNRLHGTGDSPRDIIAAFILGARKQQALPEVAFAMGYLSHCTLDRVFHPIIRRLTGDYDDTDPEKRKIAQYRHRLIETALDHQINPGCRIDQMITLGPLSELRSMRILSDRTGVARKRLRKAYSLQRRANSLFQRKWAYIFARLLQKTGKSDLKIILPLFYAHLNSDRCLFPETLTVPAYEEKTERQGGIEDLLETAAGLTEKTFHAAYVLFKDGSASARTRLQALVPDKF